MSKIKSNQIAPFSKPGVGIGGDNNTNSAALSIESTSQGFLPARMSTAQRSAIVSPAEGLQIYNTTLHQLETFDGTNWIGISEIVQDERFSVKNIIEVKKNPGIGEFSSVATAIATITDASSSNTYLVRVGPGIYTEPKFTIPSYVSITGSTINITTLTPEDPTDNFIIMSQMTEISFLNLQGHVDSLGTGKAAIYCEDIGDFAQVHKVSIYNFDVGIDAIASGADSTVYVEYTDVNNYTYAARNSSSGGNTSKLQLENFYTYGTTNGTRTSILNDGQNSQLLIHVAGFEGVSDGDTGIRCTNGGSVEISSSFFHNFDTAAVTVEESVLATDLNISAVSFKNCSLNLNIDSSTATGHFEGFTEIDKNHIDPSSTFFITGRDAFLVSVAKKGGDYDNLADALNSITDASSMKKYLIDIGPGVFTFSDTIVLKPYIDIRGSGATILQITDPTKDVIQACHSVVLSGVSIQGATSAAGVNLNTAGSSDRFKLDRCEFLNNATHINCSSPTVGVLVATDLTLRAELPYTTAINVQGTYPAINQVILNSTALIDSTAPFGTDFIKVSGTGAKAIIASTLINGGAASGAAIHVLDGASVELTSVNIAGFNKGIYAENTGSAPSVKAQATSITNCTSHLYIDHPGTTGNVNCSADRTKVTINPSSTLATLIADGVNGGISSSGEIYLGPTFETLTPFRKLIEMSTPMGKLSGGDLSIGSGLSVNIAAGYGYTMSPDVSQTLKRHDWSGTSLTLTANSSLYIYLNHSDIFSSSTSIPTTSENILLGRVVTNGTGIDFIEQSPFSAYHAANQNDTFNRVALGAIYDSGSLITQSGTRNLNISSGIYFYSSNKFTPAGGTAITFQTHYRNGSSWVRGSSTTVDNAYYDNNSGTLQLITAGNYVKHSIYVVGTGTSQKYLLVYGQELFANLTLAEQGNIPSPPSWFTDAVVLIGSLVVRGDGNATNTTYPTILTIKDERPVIGYKASGVTATSTHANLLGLSADDHTQYLLANGGRTMSGSLNMGGNTITNAGTINSIDIATHASRHLPNGADPLTTSTPVAIGSTNSVGIANALARADHVHDHGSQAGGTTHATVTTSVNGFMSATDKVKLDGVATGATVNSSDATLLNRANHTGTQAISTISGLQTALDTKANIPYTYITTTTQSSTSTTHANITELTSTTLPTGTYRFVMRGLFQSAATGNGVGIRIGTGTATVSTCYAKWNLTQANNGTASNFQYDQLTSATNVTSAGVLTSNSNFVVIGEGVVTVTVSGTLAIQLRTETAGVATSVVAGSIFVIEKLT